MRYEQDSLSYSTDRVPTLFTVDHTVLAKHQIWIGKHARRGFKIDASMLLSVYPVLFRIPLEAHALYITYNTLWKRASRLPYHLPQYHARKLKTSSDQTELPA